MVGAGCPVSSRRIKNADSIAGRAAAVEIIMV